MRLTKSGESGKDCKGLVAQKDKRGRHLRAQRASFNTGHKTPAQSKKRKDDRKKVKGS